MLWNRTAESPINGRLVRGFRMLEGSETGKGEQENDAVFDYSFGGG